MRQMDMIGMDPVIAKQAAAQGARLAAEKADRTTEQWTKTALAFVRSYAQSHAEFLTEDVRKAAIEAGIAKPPDQRAWGFVMVAAAREKVVVADGYRKQRAANCHGSPKTVWRSLVVIRKAA